MLTQEGCLTRRNRLWERIPSEIDWLLVADPRHVQYLANFWVQPLSFSGGERGLLLLERSGKTTVIGDNFAIRSAVHEPYVDREVVFPWYDHKHSVINRDHALLQALKEASADLGSRTGLVEAEWLPLGATQALKSETFLSSADQEAGDSDLIDLGTILRDLRRTKEPDEIALMEECMRAGEAGQARLFEVVREGVTELEIYREVQYAAIGAANRPGLVYGDFRANFASEPKTGGLPKGPGRTLEQGDLFVLDYSVVLDGYRSDFTNTVSVGEPSAEVVELHNICLAGMAGGEKALKAGAKASDVHAAVFAPYVEAGRQDCFTHHAGHGLGLAHPEAPILVPDSTDTLRAGDVVTLEPGAYVKGIGGMRIEHNYLITEDGYRRLSNHDIRLT
ncbi:Xaa-Pro peptidase family protein [Thalassoglobus sp. JC818]|uniref:Xaa-Pro peptidase family protein n=1 Tax=Thalassoglobus sp. JC818 TaxID=3232136 RepID=UPI00345A3262